MCCACSMLHSEATVDSLLFTLQVGGVLRTPDGAPRALLLLMQLPLSRLSTLRYHVSLHVYLAAASLLLILAILLLLP